MAIYIANNQKYNISIVYDQKLEGYYIYVYDGNTKKMLYDYFQDSLDNAMRFVADKYQITREEWEKRE